MIKKNKTKWIYLFGNGKAEGDAKMSDVLGGKGANLAEMNKIKLPVPPGFTISAQATAHFYQTDEKVAAGLQKEVLRALKHIEKHTKKKFGSEKNPLLLSVRSGARVSMPGMMDTVLNLGLNDKTTEAIVQKTNSDRFAFDSYRRFIQIYADVVCGCELNLFEDALENYKLSKNYMLDTELKGKDWRAIVAIYKDIFFKQTGEAFSQDPHEQLWQAIQAVFKSWNTTRARNYRRLHAIPDTFGTAINVQAMVFGNMGETSATGVAFTRNPSDGTKELYGEFLLNAQGEDVVAGLRTPAPINKKDKAAHDTLSLEEAMPDIYQQLESTCKKLEKHYRDMQDVEFTIEEGKLWMLQTRNAKRTAKAAVRCACDMVSEKLIDEKDAVLRVNPESLEQLLHPVLDPKATRDVLTKGLPASPGAASGEVAFSADEAERLKNQGRRVILVRAETSPEDIHGMAAAEGILTQRGGMTSHAAVVARGMGRVCVAGASALNINAAQKTLSVGERAVQSGEVITIDGSTGEVMLGEIPLLKPDMSEHFAQIMTWADQFRRMKVRTNAETPDDTKTARDFRAEGIGLCRTEHMFFDSKRILYMREMIIAQDKNERREALHKLLPLQRSDFTKLFEIMAGFPITIRLLDPPLHEFLPLAQDIPAVAKELNIEENFLARRINQLAETNPMLGHRGCRLGITYPEIYEMQTRAILEAACDVQAKSNTPVLPEIMIPLVAMRSEIDFIKQVILNTARKVLEEKNVEIDFLIGTMIELPRAALCADKLAEEADFFSFGTNDLTQMIFGISRDDSATFLSAYLQEGFFDISPFVSIDASGVGEIMKLALEKARAVKPDIKCGICGEHGGDSRSIVLCEKMNLDYISCSPYRVPIARLAAAQATIQNPQTPQSKKRKKK